MTTGQVHSYVSGHRVVGSEEVARENPARVDEVVALATFLDADAAAGAVQAARSAATPWARTPAPHRGEILRVAADLLDGRRNEVARDLVREEGKTLAEAIGEISRAVAVLRYAAAQCLGPDGATVDSHAVGTMLWSRRVPVGVVTVITPYNFPIAIPAWKIAPALAFGNTVVWKPSEIVPLTSDHLLRALVEAGIPDGVLNMVLGRGDALGGALVDDHVDAVSFTGSTGVGHAVRRAAADVGAAAQLELGGKNISYVAADSDLDLATTQIARSAFLSAGQKCTATSLVLADRTVIDSVVTALAAHATAMPVGDPLDPGTVIGPLATEVQRRRTLDRLDPASHGGELVVDGRHGTSPDGWFVGPSVVTTPRADSALCREELFAPALAVVPVDGVDEALAAVDDLPSGLTSAVFTRNLSTAHRFAERVSTGVVKVNQETAGLEYHVPFGGFGDSAHGPREQGWAAREFFTQWKTIYLTHDPR